MLCIMRRRPLRCLVVFLAGSAFPAAAEAVPATASDSLRAPESFVAPHRFLRTVGNIVIVNQTIWAYNRYVRTGVDREQFAVSWHSFFRNVEQGYVWDDNSFFVNHIYHPLQGSLHFTAARANNYNYWQSGLWAVAGSWMWEHASENNSPSTNDFVNSSLGGIAVGEVSFRLSTIVLDNTAHGGNRVMREIGGALIAPASGLNRLMSGEMFRTHANPGDRKPVAGFGEFRGGYRSLRDARGTPVSENAFLEFSMRYGDAFEARTRPFGYFDFGVVLNLGAGGDPVGSVDITGLLGGIATTSGSAQHRFGFFQHFEYMINPAWEFGQQGLGAGYLGRYPVGSFEMRPTVHLTGIVLGAMRTDHTDYWVRQYDHGVGGGTEVGVAFGGRNAPDYVTLTRADYFLRSVDGSASDHMIAMTRVQAWFPLGRRLAAGGDYLHYRAERRYRDFPHVRASTDELRIYVSLGAH